MIRGRAPTVNSEGSRCLSISERPFPDMKTVADHLAPKAPGSRSGAWAQQEAEVIGRPHLVPVLGVLLSTLVFAFMSVEFLAGTHALDRVLLFGLPAPLSGVRHGSTWLTHMALGVTALGRADVAALITALATGILCLRHRWRSALYLFSSVSIGTALAAVIKSGFGNLRPHHLTTEGMTVVLNTSFPSGHATIAALLCFSLAVVAVQEMKAKHHGSIRPWAVALAAGLTLAVGVSRVYLGVHWPSDVVAGWAFGSAWLLVWWAAFRHFVVGRAAHIRQKAAGRR